MLSEEVLMNKRTAIIAALCVIAAVPSTSVVSQQLHQSLEKPTGDVWPNGGEEIRTPLRPAAPFNADDLGPLPGNVVVSTEELGRERDKTLPSQIKLDITLTMRRTHMADKWHRSIRSCR
jgi:hypothetical protein